MRLRKETIADTAQQSREGMLNPSKRLIVIAVSGPKKYVVLEGNRRLAALKLLHQPQLAPTEALRAAFRRHKKAMGLAELLQKSGHITAAEFKKIPITTRNLPDLLNALDFASARHGSH